MYLLVIRDTTLNASSKPKGVLQRGVALVAAADSPPDEFAARVIRQLDSEPAPFAVAEGFDFSFPRRVYWSILEYKTWDALRAAARMTGQPEAAHSRTAL